LLLAASAAAQANQQHKIEGWDLWSGPESLEVAAGKPINVKATLSYGGSETTWWRADSFGFFRWKVDRINAQSSMPVPKTPFALQEWDRQRNFGMKGGPTRRGYKTEQTLDIAKYFEMSEPGEYDVTVWARVDGSSVDEKEKARSQTFRVRVVRP
jgi:hypothetical protein